MNVEPLMWEDEHGTMHFNVQALLEALGLPNTPENQEMAQATIADCVKREFPATPVYREERPGDKSSWVEVDRNGDPLGAEN